MKSWSALLFALLLVVRSTDAVSNGQTDNFQDGSTMGWQNGEVIGAIPVTNIANGGPGGTGDAYIRLSADGSGAGGKLTAFNRDQWLGDYIAAGVTAIEVDLRNEGAVSLTIRLAFKNGPGGGAGAPGYMTQAIILAVGSGWQHVTISLIPANLIAVNNPPAFSSFFIGEVRFIHSVGTSSLSGTTVVGQLGIDNIHAVPEPAVTSLLAGTFLAIAARFALRRRSP